MPRYLKDEKIMVIKWCLGETVQQYINSTTYNITRDVPMNLRWYSTENNILPEEITEFLHIRTIDRIIQYNIISISSEITKMHIRRTQINNGELEKKIELENHDFNTYNVNELEECPICYLNYGEQDDGRFLCSDGIHKSDKFTTKCIHSCCVECIKELSKADTARCPLCRENWSGFIKYYYK